MKLKLSNDFLEKNILLKRNDYKSFYLNKYYNLWLNRYNIKNVDFQQKEYILRQLWSVGQIAVFKLSGTEGATKHPQGLLVFTPFAVSEWNIYDYPIYVNLINNKGVKFIPTKRMKVNDNVCLIFAQRNHKPISYIVDFYSKRLANIEMAIQLNLIAQKNPWIFTTTPDNKNKMEALWDKILSDDPRIFIDATDIEGIKNLINGTPYIIDKLHSYKQACENELREYLGLDNLGIQEKKEHLITDEVESNDEVISTSRDSVLDCLKEGSAKVKEVLDYDLVFELNAPEDDEEDKPMAKEEEDEE